MKTCFFILGLLFVAVFGGGCVYVKELPQQDGSLMVEVNTTGWYLFDLVPIVCGDPDDHGVTWLSDTCQAQSNIKVISCILKREQDALEKDRRLKVGPIISHEVDDGILVFLLNHHEFHTSVRIEK